MKLLQKLAKSTMNQYDIDDNIVNNINSRYYSANEFKNMNKSDSFNILDSNLNGTTKQI